MPKEEEKKGNEDQIARTPRMVDIPLLDQLNYYGEKIEQLLLQGVRVQSLVGIFPNVT